MYGFHDRVAWIDLSSGICEVKKLPEAYAHKYVGGSMLGAALLADMVSPDTDPLSAENPLILMTGPFAATSVPATSRHSYVTLSPLTGIFAESSCGGSLAFHLKRGGLDGVVVTGSSDKPVSIVIDQTDISLRLSDDIWGLDTFACDEILRDELDRKGVAAEIGPAGEKLVAFASVSQNGKHTRAAGRCGVGAVFGSKKLKAIFVSSQGSHPPEIADAQGLKASLPPVLKRIKQKMDGFSKVGTTGGVEPYEMMGNLPIQNWRGASAQELAVSITGTTMLDTLVTGHTGCTRCPIRCGRVVNVEHGPYALEAEQEGPEYETIAGFGSLCLIDDLTVICKANEICNKMGMDTISGAAVCAFAMEAVEKGIIGKELLDGLDLKFGNGGAMLELLQRIADQKDQLGRLLGQGVRRAAHDLGQNANEYAVHVKGLEFPLHDPRFSWGQALSYSTSNRGACHLAGFCHTFELAITLPELGYDEPAPGRERKGKADLVIHTQNLMTLADALCLCKFAFLFNAVRITQVKDWYNLVTGQDLDLEDFITLGERGFNLKRIINNQRGISRKDDRLPERMRTHKRIGRDYTHDVPPVGQMLSDYYEIRGWSEEGMPMRDTLERLDLA